MAHDNDIPDPDAPETRAEKAKARAFAELVDGVLADAAPPPALAADERNLLEMATMVRAASSDAYDLAPARRRRLIDDALAAGAGIATDTDTVPGDELGTRRAAKLAPWLAVAVAAAAALFFALRPPRTVAPTPRTVEVIELPAAQRSRTADSLVGRIERPHAGDASARLDAIYADRSAGFRAVRFHRIGGDE